MIKKSIVFYRLLLTLKKQFYISQVDLSIIYSPIILNKIADKSKNAC